MNPLTKKLSPTATRMIRMDHTHVMAQYHKLEPEINEGQREAIVRSICAALEIHAQIEEEIFYPAVRESGVKAPALDTAVPEHDEMRRLIERVRSLDGQRAAQDDALNELINGVMHHMADEETQILPAAEKFLGAQRLAELGAQMTERRLELAKPRAAELAVDLARGAPAKTALMAVGALVAGTVLVKALSGGHEQPRGNGRHAHRS
jgi:hemerythrin-like domain-containing protein